MSEQEESSILDSEEDEEAPKPKRENSTIKQMREALDASKAELEATLARAAKYEATFLKDAGLTDKQANALKAAGYEASPEGIASFREEVLGVKSTPAADESDQSVEDSSEEEETPDEAFVPTPTGGAAPSGKREVTSDELVELTKTDPAKADKLLRSGRVVRKEFHPGGPAF